MSDYPAIRKHLSTLTPRQRRLGFAGELTRLLDSCERMRKALAEIAAECDSGDDLTRDTADAIRSVATKAMKEPTR